MYSLCDPFGSGVDVPSIVKLADDFAVTNRGDPEAYAGWAERQPLPVRRAFELIVTNGVGKARSDPRLPPFESLSADLRGLLHEAWSVWGRGPWPR